MTSVTIYHNPRCSKSRQTLALLESSRADINVVHYLDQPPGADELKKIISRLGIEPMEIVRTGEDEYKSSGLNENSGIEEIVRAILAAPKLLQRPIVVKGNKARIGRPPESVLEIL